MDQELKPINTEEELLSFAKLRGQVLIMKFKDKGPFPREENYDGLWKVLDRDIYQAISLGENESELSPIWDKMREEFKSKWLSKFKEIHQKSPRGGLGFIR